MNNSTDQPRIVAIVQARLGSTRLPRKVLRDIAGKPMLDRVMERVDRSRCIDAIVVATTTNPADQPLIEYCLAKGWLLSRGSERDVLDRYYFAAKEYHADIIIRITSDCPLVDPELIDEVVNVLLEQPAIDYASNSLEPRSYPRGLDAEAFRRSALAIAWAEDKNPATREHVTPMLRSSPRFQRVRVSSDNDHSSLRWTVDTPEDLRVVEWIYQQLGGSGFSWREVLQLLEEWPEVSAWNRGVEQKFVQNETGQE